jgi:hypothetical protein
MIINDNELELDKAVDTYYRLVKSRGFRPTVEDFEEYIFISPIEDERQLTVKIYLDLEYPESGKLQVVIKVDEDWSKGHRFITVPLSEFENYCNANYIDKYKNLKNNKEYQIMLDLWAD